MRQKVTGGLSRLGQNTPTPSGGTLPEMNTAQMAFSMNQSGAVVLPVVSDSQKLIWVYSSEINLRMDGAAELNKTFKKFPYLTQKQTTALAQRCSLHPDQVKVWFMLQRLRYGISWDCRDIRMVRRNFRSSWRKEKLQKKMGTKEKNDKVRNDERKVNREQPMQRERGRKVDKVKQNTRRKQKRMKVTANMAKKRNKQEEGGEVEKRNNEVDMEWQKVTQTETKPFSRKKKMAKKGFSSVQDFPDPKGDVVHDELLDAVQPIIPQSQTQDFEVLPFPENKTNVLKSVPEAPNHDPAHTEVCKLRFIDVLNNIIVAGGAPNVTEQQISNVVESCRLITRVRRNTKRRSQLAMMKVAFLYCQYPNGADYSRLAMAIDIPREMLVQWFGDMRYSIKKGRPRWMSQEQHSQVLANIQYRQCLNTLIKTQAFVAASESCEEAAWKMTFEKSESCGEEEIMPAPLEWK